MVRGCSCSFSTTSVKGSSSFFIWALSLPGYPEFEFVCIWCFLWDTRADGVPLWLFPIITVWTNAVWSVLCVNFSLRSWETISAPAPLWSVSKWLETFAQLSGLIVSEEQPVSQGSQKKNIPQFVGHKARVRLVGKVPGGTWSPQCLNTTGYSGRSEACNRPVTDLLGRGTQEAAL